MSVPDWRQPQGLRGRPGFKPTCRAEFAAWTASGRAGLGSGGRRQGLAGLRDDAPSERSATKRRRCGGRHRACGAWPRCRWAAAGPGWASRRRAKRTISNQAPAVWRPPRGLRGLASVPVGGGRTWLGFETTRQANDQQPSAGGVEAAAGPAGPGRGAGGRRQDQGWASRRRAKRTISNQAPAVWRPPRGLRGLAAVPEGGGRTWPGFEIDHSEPQARVWRSRGRAAAHRHTQRPNPTRQAPRRPGPTVPGKPVVPQAPPESQNSS